MGGATLVACIGSVTASWRQKRDLVAQRERQDASILAEDRRQAAEFARTRELADLKDVRSVLDNMIRALHLADEIRGELAAGASPQQDAVRAACRSLGESATLCRLRLGANDSVTIGYSEFRSAFDALVGSGATATHALLAYSIAREQFNDIATERFGSRALAAAPQFSNAA